jgi:hypothetical protein
LKKEFRKKAEEQSDLQTCEKIEKERKMKKKK